MSQAALGMVMPPFSQFIRFAPTSLLSNAPNLWLEDCLAGGTDHIVLVDADAVPVRILLLHHLIGMVEAQKSPAASSPEAGMGNVARSLPKAVSDPALTGYSPVTIALISVTQSFEAAAQMVAASPDAYWIVVDQQQRYLGLLDKTSLLAIALTQRSPASEQSEDTVSSLSTPDSLETAAVTAQQPFSQSNTALLTYLGHELKTPLTSLLGLSSLLKTRRLGELNARQTRYVSLIQQHSRRLAAWVNTLIDLGRIDSGTLKIIPRIIDLCPLWQEAYRQAALRIGWEEAQMPTLPPLLRSNNNQPALVADPPRLQQMLTCLMQAALVNQSNLSGEAQDLPLMLEVWDDWITFVLPGLNIDFCLDQLTQVAVRLPFSGAPVASTSVSAEMGHLLEWLLTRKLAQLHGGELVLLVHPQSGVCPTLLLPTTPASPSTRKSRLLLLIAPNRVENLDPIRQQATQLNYRLLVTRQVSDAIEIASHIALYAILVMIEKPQNVSDLKHLKANLETSKSLIIALVPPQQSALLGELPADRELLWPANTLGR
ncbi:MAG: HAMP domain-containing histidine kinase, partial [Leptolyngbya sp. SIO1D8]|nr:HAMP domain-containing histidine kinase [Leptolyngbya sp. SIO1D8]